MHRLLIALALAVAIFATAQTAQKPAAKSTPSEKGLVLAVINEFIDDFNKGNMDWVKMCADPTSIIDEFPPYQWHGSDACKRWAADYDADAKKNGITEPRVVLGNFRHVEIAGDRAYVVEPAEYDYRQKGKPTKEVGSTLTTTLQKTADGWRITAWTWSKN